MTDDIQGNNDVCIGCRLKLQIISTVSIKYVVLHPEITQRDGGYYEFWRQNQK